MLFLLHRPASRATIRGFAWVPFQDFPRVPTVVFGLVTHDGRVRQIQETEETSFHLLSGLMTEYELQCAAALTPFSLPLLRCPWAIPPCVPWILTDKQERCKSWEKPLTGGRHDRGEKGLQAENIYEETFISDPGGAVIPAALSHAGCFSRVYESSSPFLGMSCFNNSNAFLIPASESLPGSIGMCVRQQARR